MLVYNHKITFETTDDVDVINLTDHLNKIVESSGVVSGQILTFVAGSTAAVTTIEFESGAISDLKEAIERLAPRTIPYKHDERWHDGNGYSHVRAALLGPSQYLPVINGRAVLGTWQHLILLDFDNKHRQRTVVFQVMGNA